MKYIILFFIQFCVIFSCFSALNHPTVTVKEISTLDPVIAELTNNIDNNTLVVFDVDYVLIVPKDRIARPCSRSLRRTLFNDLEKEVGKQYLYHDLFGIIRARARNDLVDQRLPQVIKNLQERSINVIALTAQSYGSLGMIKDEGSLRMQELQQLGLDFQKTFPSIAPFKISIVSPRNTLPLYRDGIILTDRSPKGKTLIAFIKKIQWTPSKVIFIDDGKEHIENMRQELLANDINGTLFH